jgi:hypothetical protein
MSGKIKGMAVECLESKMSFIGATAPLENKVVFYKLTAAEKL